MADEQLHESINQSDEKFVPDNIRASCPLITAVIETAGRNVYSLPEWMPTADAANEVDSTASRVRDLSWRLRRHLDELEKRLGIKDPAPLHTTVYTASADLLVATARHELAYALFKQTCKLTLGQEVLDKVLRNRFPSGT